MVYNAYDAATSPYDYQPYSYYDSNYSDPSSDSEGKTILPRHS